MWEADCRPSATTRRVFSEDCCPGRNVKKLERMKVILKSACKMRWTTEKGQACLGLPRVSGGQCAPQNNTILLPSLPICSNSNTLVMKVAASYSSCISMA